MFVSTMSWKLIEFIIPLCKMFPMLLVATQPQSMMDLSSCLTVGQILIKLCALSSRNIPLLIVTNKFYFNLIIPLVCKMHQAWPDAVLQTSNAEQFSGLLVLVQQ